MTLRYKSFYGSTFSIKENRDGTAILRCWENSHREKKTYSSVANAKRALSRRCDGMPRRIA